MSTGSFDSRYRKVMKLLDAVTNRERYELFDDFVEMCALNLSIPFDPVHREARAKRMTVLTIKHGADILERFREAYALLGQLALAHFDDGELFDMLGYLFFLCGYADDGQSFTPPDVTRLMAQLAFIQEGGHRQQGYMDLYDHALGSGSTLLAGAELLMQEGYNINRDFVLCGNDLDPRCIHMAFAQVSLYGLPAVFCHGNTLTLEEWSKWWTPMYIHGQWVMRRPFSMKSGANRTDQLLKITTVPYYGATLEAHRLMCGLIDDKEGDSNASD